MNANLWRRYLGYLWETRIAQWWRSGRNLARYAWNHRRRRRMPGRPVVYLDIVDDTFHRYLFSLCHYFEAAGYDVFLRFRRALVGRMCYYARFLLRSRNLYICWRRPPGARMAFRYPGSEGGSHCGLSPDYFRAAGSGEYHVPIGMYVSMYVMELEAECVARSATGTRPVSVFLAGNMDAANYGNEEVETCFGCLQRPLVVATVRAMAGEMRVHSPAPGEHDFGVSSAVDVLLVDSARCFIEPLYLPSVLTRSAFYLAPPGTVMPLCHNIVEAMAAGCIPILEYAQWIYPPLQDAVNCVAFQGVDGLRAAIRRAVAMPESEVHAMRENVRRYYAQHLAPVSVVRTIERRYADLRCLLVNAEHASVACLKRRLRSSR